MLRFYYISIFIFLSISIFAQGYNFSNLISGNASNVSNDCLNGGAVATASITVSGLDVLSNDFELKFAGADLTIGKTFDLKITVISPQGTRATFLDTRAGSNFPVQIDKYNLFRARNCDWFLPHTSPQLVPWQAGKLFCFRPVTDFSIFKGENPNGEWKFEFCSTNASELSLGFLMLEFRSLKAIITPPVIVKKPTDCLSADGTITFNFGTKCDQGLVYYTVDNQPWQVSTIPVDYTLGFVNQITNTISGLKAGKHTIKAVLGDPNGYIYSNTYNEREFTLEAATGNGDIQVLCAKDFTVGNGTTGSVNVQLIPPLHWDNCGLITSITKITGKFSNGDFNVDLNTQSLVINGTGRTEFVWEITNSKGQKKTCSSFVTTVTGNVAVFTANTCGIPVKVSKCDYSRPMLNIPVNISQLPKLGTTTKLDKVELTMKFPTTCTGEAYLIDPKGNSYLLFNQSSFPTYNNSGSMTVEFTTDTDPFIKSHNASVLPSSGDKLRKPIGNLNLANLRKINPNGTWYLAVCDNNAAGFDIECIKFYFNDACIKDQEAPTFTQCPANQVVVLGSNNLAEFNIRDPFSTDNCKVKSRVQEITYLDGTTSSDGKTSLYYDNIDADQGNEYKYSIVGKGRAIIVYTTTDEANNLGRCYVYIYAVGPNDCASDQLKPVLVDCVPDFEITAYPNGVTDYYTTDPAFYDNCGIKSTQLNITYVNGAKSLNNSTFETFKTFYPRQTFTYNVLGTGKVYFDYSVTDLKGNVGTCRTVVTVKPAIPGTDPCTSFKPSLAVAGGNCINNIMTVNDAAGAVRIDWKNGSQIVQSSVSNSTPVTQGSTVAGTGIAGGSNSQFAIAQNVALDKSGNLYVVDTDNHRILKFSPGATTGTVVAGGNGAGNALNQLNKPWSVYVDKDDNVFIADFENHRVVRWAPGATSGVVVAGGNGAGSALNQLDGPVGVYIDDNGNIYVADFRNYRIQKWVKGASQGTTVAGVSGSYGSDANQLNTIRDIAVNSIGEIFVMDNAYGQVKKFPANSTQGTPGIIVAKDKAGDGNGNNPTRGMCMDAAGNIYIANIADHYIKKFPPNGNENTQGVIIAGGNGAGSGANQLNGPRGVVVDGQNNIYILDQINYRVQKWAQSFSTLDYTFKPTTAGSYTAEVTRADGCTKTTNSLTITDCNTGGLLFTLGAGCITPGNTGSFPVTVNNFTGIGAFQFDLSLPANSNLKFEKADNFGLNNIQYNILQNGDIRITWDEPNGQNINLANGTRILDIFISANASFAQPVIVTGKEVVVLSSTGVSSGSVASATICVSSKVTITGTVKNPSNKGISNVDIAEYDPAAQAWVNNQVKTNSTGVYSLSQVTPTHQIIPGFINDDPLRGVNVADVARIRRHVLQITQLDTDYKKMAADVDLNGVINVVDAAVTNRMVLKKINKFPNNEAWRFVPADYNISANPLDVNIPWWYDLTKPGLNTSKLDFIAIKVGDVDFSSALHDNAVESRLAPVVLSIPDTVVTPSQSMVIPVYVSGGDKISIFSMNLAYDTSKVKLEKIESSMMQGFGSGNYNDLGGNVLIAWDHPQGGSFVGTGKMMLLTFSNKVSSGTSPLNMTNVSLYDEDFNQYTSTSDDGSIIMKTSGVNDLNDAADINIYPNPFTEVLNIEVEMHKSSNITIEVMDETGKVLRTFNTGKDAGRQVYQIKDLDYKGVLLVKTTSGHFTKTFKVIKIQ